MLVGKITHLIYKCAHKTRSQYAQMCGINLFINSTINEIITARKRSLQRLCFYTCLSVHGGYPSMPCRWYPSMPCRSPGGCIPACLAGFQAHTQGGAWGVWPGGYPGPHPRGKVVVYPSMHWGWRLLLRAVRILLECILVCIFLHASWIILVDSIVTPEKSNVVVSLNTMTWMFAYRMKLGIWWKITIQSKCLCKWRKIERT